MPQFVLQQSPTYWWPVVFSLPSRTEAGKHQEQGFEGLFHYFDNERHAALMKEIGEKQLSDREVAPRVLAGWREVRDASGADVPFDAEALQQALVIPGVASGICRAYLESRQGAVEKK